MTVPALLCSQLMQLRAAACLCCPLVALQTAMRALPHVRTVLHHSRLLHMLCICFC